MSKDQIQASSLGNKIAAGVLGAVTTMIVQKLIHASWKTITGTEPPDPEDLEVSTASVVTWTAASALGVAVAQVIIRRFTLGKCAELIKKRIDTL